MSSPHPPLFDEFSPPSTEKWKAQIRRDLGGDDPETLLSWESIEGLSLSALQRREDLESVAHVSATAAAPPLTEASSPGNGWRLRQDLRAPDPEAAPSLAHAAVDGGCSDLGLCLAPPEGLVLDHADALAALLSDLPSSVPVHLDAGLSAALGFAALRDRNAGSGPSIASVGYDPVAALATGAVPTVEGAFTLGAALQNEAPSDIHTVTVDLRPYHNAGASAVQELAFGLGALSEMLHQYTERGLPLSTVCSRLQIHTSVATSYVTEIAKLRALRLLVPQVLGAYAETANASLTPAPSDLLVQATTSRRTETVYDPYVNMLRGTTAAMAAVLGGCDVLSVRAYDAALRPPDRFGTRIARNLQHLLKHEAHLDLVDDPAAGAYFLEAVTDQLARRAWGAFQEVEASGGLLAALQAGRVQSAIGDVRTRRIQAVDDRNRVLVGTNHYPNVEEQRSLEPNDELICNNRSEYRIEWGSRPLDELHSRLDAGASIPALAAALAADDAHEIDPLPRVRVAEGIEQVRRRTEQAASRPRILIAPIGPPGPRSARATFARHFFGVAGFDVKSPLRFETPDEAAAEAARESAAVVALCSADTEYASLAPALRAALHAHNCSPLLVVAGHPSQISDQVTADWFIHRHSSLRQTLEAIQDRLALSPLDESSS